MTFRILLFCLLTLNLPGVNAQNSVVLDPNAFAEALKSSANIQLIDLRPSSEFEAGHIKRAVNYDFLDDNFEKTALKNINKNQPVYLYCFTGIRSKNASQFLRDLGYRQIYELGGGFAKWAYSSKPYVSGSPQVKPFAVFTEENFNMVVQTNNIVLIDFYTESCVPCKKITPLYEKIKAENKNVKLLRIDTDHNELMVQKFEIEENPTLIIYKYGRQVWRTTGAISEKDLKTIIEK